MVGITDTNSIDLVAQDADGTVLLVMIEDRTWGADPRQPSRLRDKINAYAGYIVNGTLVEHYPEVAGAPVRIRLDCVSAPTGMFAEFVDFTAKELARRGIDFQINPKG